MIVDQNVYDFLEHQGVKGMKWGVRRDRRVVRLSRAGVKGGSKLSKIRNIGNIGPVDFVKGRGLTGAAKRKSTRQKQRNKRIRQGKATARDRLAFYGGTRAQDLIPVRRKNVGKKTIVDSDKIVVAAAGALIAVKILSRVAKNNA